MKLNLGCGSKREPGYVGVDRYPGDATDVVCDITRTLPFASDVIDEILLENVVEHIPDVASFARELARVGCHGCLIRVRTPHFSSQASWRDPTHLHHLSYFSPDHFEHRWLADYSGKRLRVVRKQLRFRGPMGAVGRLIFAFSPKLYEREFCFVFRARTLYFELIVDKSPLPCAAGAAGEASGSESSTPTSEG